MGFSDSGLRFRADAVDIDGDYVIVIMNQKGARWKGLHNYGDMVAAVEASIILAEQINDGVKLEPSKWERMVDA